MYLVMGFPRQKEHIFNFSRYCLKAFHSDEHFHQPSTRVPFSSFPVQELIFPYFSISIHLVFEKSMSLLSTFFDMHLFPVVYRPEGKKCFYILLIATPLVQFKAKKSTLWTKTLLGVSWMKAGNQSNVCGYFSLTSGSLSVLLGF